MDQVERQQVKRVLREENIFVPRHIDIKYVTVRQSITFLVLKIIVLDIIAAVLVGLFFTGLCQINTNQDIITSASQFTTWGILIFALLKIGTTLYVGAQWLNEYYEITPTEILHRSGIIFRTHERFYFKHISSMKLNQGIFGRLFNFGSLELFDWALDKQTNMYLIHDPQKYLRVMESLMPQTDEEKEVFREHFLESRDVIDD